MLEACVLGMNGFGKAFANLDTAANLSINLARKIARFKLSTPSCAFSSGWAVFCEDDKHGGVRQSLSAKFPLVSDQSALLHFQPNNRIITIAPAPLSRPLSVPS